MNHSSQGKGGTNAKGPSDGRPRAGPDLGRRVVGVGRGPGLACTRGRVPPTAVLPLRRDQPSARLGPALQPPGPPALCSILWRGLLDSPRGHWSGAVGIWTGGTDGPRAARLAHPERGGRIAI